MGHARGKRTHPTPPLDGRFPVRVAVSGDEPEREHPKGERSPDGAFGRSLLGFITAQPIRHIGVLALPGQPAADRNHESGRQQRGSRNFRHGQPRPASLVNRCLPRAVARGSGLNIVEAPGGSRAAEASLPGVPKPVSPSPLDGDRHRAAGVPASSASSISLSSGLWQHAPVLERDAHPTGTSSGRAGAGALQRGEKESSRWIAYEGYVAGGGDARGCHLRDEL